MFANSIATFLYCSNECVINSGIPIAVNKLAQTLAWNDSPIKVKTGANEEMTPQEYQKKGMPFKGKNKLKEIGSSYSKISEIVPVKTILREDEDYEVTNDSLLDSRDLLGKHDSGN